MPVRAAGNLNIETHIGIKKIFDVFPPNERLSITLTYAHMLYIEVDLFGIQE